MTGQDFAGGDVNDDAVILQQNYRHLHNLNTLSRLSVKPPGANSKQQGKKTLADTAGNWNDTAINGCLCQRRYS